MYSVFKLGHMDFKLTISRMNQKLKYGLVIFLSTI